MLYNGDEQYLFYLDKVNDEGVAEVLITLVDDFKQRTSEDVKYSLHFDRNTEYNAENCDVKNVILYNENTGMEYLLKENSRIALSVPVGNPLTVAALEALLLAGGVVIIAGIAYTIVEEVALALKRQKQYKYYSAVLRNDAVYVGNALSDKSAKALAYTNDESGTVFGNLLYCRIYIDNWWIDFSTYILEVIFVMKVENKDT